MRLWRLRARQRRGTGLVKLMSQAFGAEALHVVRDGQHGRHLPQRVGQPAGSAVLAVGLAHAELERDLPIAPPEPLARPNLDGDDDEVRAGKDLLAAGGADDGHARVPLPVQPAGQGVDQVQAFPVEVDEGDGAAAHTRAAHECGQGLQAKAGAAGADDDDFWIHGYFLRMRFPRVAGEHAAGTSACRVPAARQAGSIVPLVREVKGAFGARLGRSGI